MKIKFILSLAAVVSIFSLPAAASNQIWGRAIWAYIDTSKRFDRVAPGEVLDLETGLIWQTTGSNATSYFSARTNCAQYGRGFRLPKTEELTNIENAVLDENSPFSNMTTTRPFSSRERFWTATNSAGSELERDTVVFATVPSPHYLLGGGFIGGVNSKYIRVRGDANNSN